jgi:hypothetical protein
MLGLRICLKKHGKMLIGECGRVDMNRKKIAMLPVPLGTYNVIGIELDGYKNTYSFVRFIEN